MDITYADITLENTFIKRKLAARALVDSGSVFMTLPAHLAIQLRVFFADRYCGMA